MVTLPDLLLQPVSSVAWLEVLADATIKGLSILLLASALHIAMRRASAASRHLLWCLALSSLLALPVLSSFLPAWQVPILSRVLSTHLAPDGRGLGPVPNRTVPMPAELQPRWGGRVPDDLMFPPADAANGRTPANRQSEESQGKLTSAATATAQFHWAAWILLFWMVGLLAVLTPLLIGTGQVWRLARRAKPVTEGRWTTWLPELVREIGLTRRVRLLRSHRATMPMTWGIRRPVVLLPADADDWSPERGRIVLLHELAHVKRWDCLTQMLAQLSCAFYWFNPLAWLAAHWLRAERERACDDLVLRAGSRPSDYAGHLLEITRSHYRLHCAPIAAVAMARRSHIERRVLAILDASRSRRALTKLTVAVALAAGACVVLPLAMMRATARNTTGPNKTELGERTAEANNGDATLPGAMFTPDEVVAHYEKLYGEKKTPAELAKFYSEQAIRAASSGSDPFLLVEAVERALALEKDVVVKGQLFTYLGDAYWLQTKKYTPEIWGPQRRKAAEVYLTGLRGVLEYDLPAQPPELPGVAVYNVDGPPEVVEKYRKKHEQEMAARKKAEFERDLVHRRQVLTGQVVQMYAKEPDAFDELRELVLKHLGSAEAADTLIAGAGDYRKNPKPQFPVLKSVGNRIVARAPALADEASSRVVIIREIAQTMQPIEYDREIPVNLWVGTNGTSGVVQVPRVKFLKSDDRIEAIVHVTARSAANAKWRIGVTVLDENGGVLGEKSAVIRTMRLILGKPFTVAKDLSLQFGRVAGRPVKFMARVLRVAEDTPVTEEIWSEADKQSPAPPSVVPTAREFQHQANLSFEEPLYCDMPVWVHVEFSWPVENIRYPFNTAPGFFDDHVFLVERDGKPLPRIRAADEARILTGGLLHGSVAPASVRGNWFPLHLIYRFDVPGVYSVRYSNPRLDHASDWTKIEVRPFTAEQRHDWLKTTMAKPPDDLGKLVSEYLPSILACPDREAFPVWTSFLYHDSNLVGSYSMYGLHYYDEAFLRDELPKVLARNGATPDLAHFLNAKRDLFQPVASAVVNALLPFLKTGSPSQTGGAIQALYSMKNDYTGDAAAEMKLKIESATLENLDALMNSNDPAILHPLALFLGTTKTDRARQALWQLSKNEAVGEQALICIAWHANKDDLPKLAEAMISGDERARPVPYHLRRAFGNDVVPYLLKGLRESPNDHIKVECARELVLEGEPAAFQFFQEQLEKGSPLTDNIRQFLLDHFRAELADSSDKGVLDFVSARLEKREGAADERGWGPASEGVQCRLVADKPVWKAGEIPTFKADVRNQGTRNLIVAQAQELCEMEFDGRWFVWLGPIHVKSSALDPGRQYANIPISLVSDWRSKDAREPLKLAPGKHTIRIAFIASPQDRDSGSPVRAVSNPVSIEIAAQEGEKAATAPPPNRLAASPVGSIRESAARVKAAVRPYFPTDNRPATPQRIVYRGLDLTTAPVTTRYEELPDLFEDRPPGSKSYHIRDDVVRSHVSLSTGTVGVEIPNGEVFYIAEKNIYYVQCDPMGASTLHYYGPFAGNPLNLMPLQLAGIVQAPDGKPLTGADVILVAPEHEARFLDGRFVKQWHNRTEKILEGMVAKTDANGRFSLTPRSKAYVLVVLHEQGYSEVALAELAGSPNVTAQPWARIEGTVLKEGNALANAKVNVSSPRAYDQGGPGKNVWLREGANIRHQSSVLTDENGRFVIEKVPPGQAFVSRELEYGVGGDVPVVLKAGETRRVTIGRERPVVGRLISAAGSNLQVDPAHTRMTVFLRPPSVSGPTDSVKEIRSVYNGFLGSEDGKVYRRERVELQDDGSFRVDLLPARYVLQVRVYAQPLGPEGSTGTLVGWLAQRFAVPAATEGREDEKPVDLGPLQVPKAK